MNRKPHVVVLGGGFGGLACAKALIGAEVEVTLIDRQNHHLFQPLLYQVATAGLSLPEIAQPIRSILRPRDGFTVLMDEATSIDAASRRVLLKNGGPLGYDFLVIALGAVTSYFGHPEWARHAPGLKSLDDAARIRREVLLAFERAETCDDPGVRQRLMTMVVIGGGPTGVEMAGALAELAKVVLKRDFRRIDPAQARIILIEASAKILDKFADPLPQKARRQLEALGVEVRTSTRVQDIRAGEVHLQGSGEILRAANIIWGAGVMAHPITATLGVPLDRAGRILVQPDCTLPGHPEVFAIGDIVSLKDANGVQVPGVSPAAIQMGTHAAACIRSDLMHAGAVPHPAFTYWDKGSMATIGRSAAITQIGEWKLSGFVAWVLWLFVHLVFLIGFRNRLAVLLQWAYSYLRYKRGARIIAGWEPVPSG